MTLTIEVSGELEAAVIEQAREQGLTAEKLVRRVLAHVLTPGMEGAEEAFSGPSGTSGEEKGRAFVEWAESFPDTPPLSDEAISRASMYPDRW